MGELREGSAGRLRRRALTSLVLSPRDRPARVLALLLLSVGAVVLCTMWLLTSEEANSPQLAAAGMGAVALGLFLFVAEPRGLAGPGLLWPAAGALLLMGVVNHGVTGALGPYRVMYVLIFAFVGLTQPPKTSFKLLPLAAATYLVPELGNHDRSLTVVGLIVALPVWVLAAEVLAAGTHRLRDANLALEARNLEVEEHAAFQRDFVATASHELRTPITSITGYVELLQDDQALSDEQRGHLRVVARNTDRLTAIVQDLLTINRSDAGHLDLDVQETTLDDVLTPIVEAYEEVCRAKGIALTVRFEDRPVRVLVDRRRMEQVFGNLINNAAKFTPAGGTIAVATARAGDRVDVSVGDSGVGIPAAEVDRVFDRFFRSSTSIDMAVPGTGLGLAIAKSMVESQRGRISVDSIEGRGTTFTVSLPIERA